MELVKVACPLRLVLLHFSIFFVLATSKPFYFCHSGVFGVTITQSLIDFHTDSIHCVIAAEKSAEEIHCTVPLLLLFIEVYLLYYPGCLVYFSLVIDSMPSQIMS